MFAEFFKELVRVHTYTEVATPQQREEWANQPCRIVVTDTEDRNSDNKYITMPFF